MLNQFLEEDVTFELKVVSELQCWDYCIRQKDCKAYNYYHAIGQSLKTCQLLSNDVGLPISQKGCTYHIINNKKKNIKVSSDFNVCSFKRCVSSSGLFAITNPKMSAVSRRGLKGKNGS